jgi:hypothetical protein
MKVENNNNEIKELQICDSYHKGTSLYVTPITKGHPSIYLIFHSLPFSRFVLIDREILSIGISGSEIVKLFIFAIVFYIIYILSNSVFY